MVNFEVALITPTAREKNNGVRDVAYSDSWPSGSSIAEAVSVTFRILGKCLRKIRFSFFGACESCFDFTKKMALTIIKHHSVLGHHCHETY